MARRHQVYLLAGSFPVREGDGYRNRAGPVRSRRTRRLAGQAGDDPLRARTLGDLCRRGLTLFETAIGRLGILICYDAEFPLLARALVAAGADLLLVPSCTDGWAGYHRVRIACQARALEGQCYVVQSPTVGEAPWSPAVDVNVGRAGVFCPPDRGLPEDGVIALGRDGAIGWTVAELDLDLIGSVRTDGQVLNRRDWTEPSRGGDAVCRVSL